MYETKRSRYEEKTEDGKTEDGAFAFRLSPFAFPPRARVVGVVGVWYVVCCMQWVYAMWKVAYLPYVLNF